MCHRGEKESNHYGGEMNIEELEEGRLVDQYERQSLEEQLEAEYEKMCKQYGYNDL
jgi:hypothetical protein